MWLYVYMKNFIIKMCDVIENYIWKKQCLSFCELIGRNYVASLYAIKKQI